MNRTVPILLVALCMCVMPHQSQAQLSAESRARVIDSLAKAVSNIYPAADTGAMIAQQLRARAAAGAYSGASDPALFARLVTQDLQSTNHDTHLVLDMAGGAQGGAAPPAGHGVEQVDRLEGNVGYLRMSHFLGGNDANVAVEHALRELERTDAIILDLRNSRGGSAALANFLISHFAPADTQHSLTVYDRVRNTSFERYTMPSVPGPRRPDVPLFVLVDDVTRSAAEDVPFVLQNMKRATIVGSNTAGAGRNNTIVPVGEGFVASISFTRVMEPVTHREWERTGITPNVRVHPDSALPVAHALALEAIAARTADVARQRELRLTAEVVRAARQRSLGSRRHRDYIGTYEGGQYVTLDGDRLVYQSRVAQPRVELVSMPDGSFGAGSARYLFAGTGAHATLKIVTADGRSTVYARTSASVPLRRM